MDLKKEKIKKLIGEERFGKLSPEQLEFLRETVGSITLPNFKGYITKEEHKELGWEEEEGLDPIEQYQKDMEQIITFGMIFGSSIIVILMLLDHFFNIIR